MDIVKGQERSNNASAIQTGTNLHLCWMERPIGFIQGEWTEEQGFPVFTCDHGFQCKVCGRYLYRADKSKILLPPVTQAMRERAEYDVMSACAEDLNIIEDSMKREAASISQRLEYHVGPNVFTPDGISGPYANKQPTKNVVVRDGTLKRGAS